MNHSPELGCQCTSPLGGFEGVSPCSFRGDHSQQAVDVGDYNGDGLLDVVIKENNAYYSSGKVSVCEREVTGGLKSPVILFEFDPLRYMNDLKMIPCLPMKGLWPCFILDTFLEKLFCQHFVLGVCGALACLEASNGRRHESTVTAKHSMYTHFVPNGVYKN